MSNTFGQLFRVTTFGESHGGGVGVVIDGCPPNVDLSETEIQRELDRRRPGQKKINAKFSLVSLRARHWARRSRFWCATKTHGHRTTRRSPRNFGLHTLTL